MCMHVWYYVSSCNFCTELLNGKIESERERERTKIELQFGLL